MKLHYDSDEFPVTSRKAIVNGEAFSFEVRGRAWELLRSEVVDNAIPNWAHMSAIPELRSLTVLMALAGSLGVAVSVSDHNDHAKVIVGTCH